MMMPHWFVDVRHAARCPFCMNEFDKRDMIDNRCPRCHIQLNVNTTNDKEGGEEIEMGQILSVDGISQSMPFVTKIRTLVEKRKRDIAGVEIGHGYAVIEFKWPMDINKAENHIRQYLPNVYKGWDIKRSDKFLCIVDKLYPKHQPDSRLPAISLPAPKPSDNDAASVAPNESEEDDGKKDS